MGGGHGHGRRAPNLGEIKASLEVIFAGYQYILHFRRGTWPVVTCGDGESLMDESIKLSPRGPQLS